MESAMRSPGFPGDPVAAYGTKAAAILMQTMDGQPVAYRKPLLKEMLNHIDPTLWQRVSDKADELRKSKGYDARTALQKALAVCMASGLLLELDAYGKGKKVVPQSHMGLGIYGVDGYEALGFGFSLSSVTSAISSAAKAVGSTVASGAKTVASGVATGAKAVASGVATGAKAVASGTVTGVKAVGGAIATGAKAAYNAGKVALNAIGSAACLAASVAKIVPPVTPATAGVAVGAQVVSAVCSGGGHGGPAQQQLPVAPPATGFMDTKVAGIPMPLLLAGGGVVLFLALRKD